jgi:hypothetical protein
MIVMIVMVRLCDYIYQKVADYELIWIFHLDELDGLILEVIGLLLDEILNILLEIQLH